MTKTEVNQVNQGEKRGRGRPKKERQEVGQLVKSMQAVGYIRVSTDKQEYEAQRAAINEAAAKEGYKVVTYIEETVSSKEHYTKRKINQMIQELEAGTVVITYEASRLARNMMELAAIVQEIKNKGGGVWIISNDLKIGLNKENEVLGEFMLMALGLAAQLERQFIRERTTNALKQRRKEGVTLGRPAGKGKKVAEAIASKGLDKQQFIEMRQKWGFSVAKLAKMAGVNRLTMDEWLKENI